MYYVYLLKSTRYDWKYIGVTADLRVRVQQHNSGEVFSTKARAPYKLIYYEAYLNKEEAQERERMLKNYGSTLGHLKKRLSKTLRK